MRFEVFRSEISGVDFFDGSDQDYFKICSSRLPHWLSHRLLSWRAKASEVVTVNMAPKRLRRKKRLRSGKEELLFKVGLPNQSVRKAKKQRTGNSCAMGTTEWFKMLEQFRTGPETLQEYFMSHIDPLRSQLEEEPARLQRLISMLQYGVEMAEEFAGIRFPSETTRLIEETFDKYMHEQRKNYLGGNMFFHSRACDLGKATDQLVHLSEVLDNRRSCVFNGIGSRISQHHLNKFVEIFGKDRPKKAGMSPEQKQEQKAKFDQFLEYVKKHAHQIFPPTGQSRCECHDRMCSCRPIPKFNSLGLHPKRLRGTHSSPECHAWTGAGVGLGFCDDTEFSAILNMQERRVLATDGVEDFWSEEGGPMADVPTKTADLQSTHAIVFAKVGPEHNGLCFGRRRTFSAGLALASIVYTGPVEPDEIQQDFMAFI